MNWQHFEPFLVALAIGLLLGLERERSHTRDLPAGSRSFALLSLAGGAIASGIDARVVAAGAIGVAVLLAVAYRRTRADDPGTTTVIAGLVAYLLGALAYTRPAEAVALAWWSRCCWCRRPAFTASPERSSARWNSRTRSSSSWWPS